MPYFVLWEIDCFCELDKQFQYDWLVQKSLTTIVPEVNSAMSRNGQKMVRGGNTCFGKEALTVNIGSFTTWLKLRCMATLERM